MLKKTDAKHVGVLSVSPHSPHGVELMGKYLESFRHGVESGDPAALREAIDAVLVGYAPPWLIDAWQKANPRPKREQWRGFVVFLIAILERRGRTRQQAFAETAAHIGRGMRWVEVLFREPASRPWRKLFRLPERQR
jgi:hypothetical protein